VAISATLYYDDGFVGLMLLPIGEREKVADAPDVAGYEPATSLYYYWDAVKLIEHNEYDFLGIEITDIGRLYDTDLEVIDSLNLPRVNVTEAGIVDGTVGDVLRWARKVYPSRYSTASS
jgi:hypothetical protein